MSGEVSRLPVYAPEDGASAGAYARPPRAFRAAGAVRSPRALGGSRTGRQPPAAGVARPGRLGAPPAASNGRRLWTGSVDGVGTLSERPPVSSTEGL
jgi:hypothetical protein